MERAEATRETDDLDRPWLIWSISWYIQILGELKWHQITDFSLKRLFLLGESSQVNLIAVGD